MLQPPNLAVVNLPWWASTHKVTWPFDHVVLWDHITTSNCYIFTTTAFMATKLNRMVTYIQAAPNHEVTQWFEHGILECCVVNRNHYISSTTVLMASKISWIITQLDGLLPRESHDFLITWSCKIDNVTN